MQLVLPSPFQYQHLAALLNDSHLYIHRTEKSVIITHWCAQFCTELHELLRPYQPEHEGSFFCWPIAETGFQKTRPGIEHLWAARSQIPPLVNLHLTNGAVPLGHGIVCRVFSDERGNTFWVQRALTDVLHTSVRMLMKHYCFELLDQHQVRVLFSEHPSVSAWKPIALLMLVRQNGEDPNPLGLRAFLLPTSTALAEPSTSETGLVEALV